MDIIEFIKERIEVLRSVDKEYLEICQDKTQPDAVRAAARDYSNEAHSRRQELESVLRCFPDVAHLKASIFAPLHMN